MLYYCMFLHAFLIKLISVHDFHIVVTYQSFSTMGWCCYVKLHTTMKTLLYGIVYYYCIIHDWQV